MCSSPSIPNPTQYQASKSPVYRDREDGGNTGRRSTILTGGSGVTTPTPSVKKTALGQ